jgi:hypothetical protein
MSGIDCFVILAHLCIHSVPSVSVRDSTLHKNAEIHGPDFDVSVMWNTDNIRTPNWAKMNQACGYEGCIAYFKHCDSTVKLSTCEYHFSQPGERQNTVVEIKAASDTKLRETESAIGVLVRAGWNLEEISLAKFTINSDETTPPYCSPRILQSACWGESK